MQAQNIAQNGLKVEFTGKFQNKDRPWLQHAANFSKRARSFGEMVQHADHGGGIEETIREGQAVDIPGDVGVALALAETSLGLLHLGEGVVEQYDALKVFVAQRVASGARAQFEHEFAFGGQQAAQGYGFGLIFVGAPTLFPKCGLVVGAFVITNRRLGLSHVFNPRRTQKFTKK